MEIIEELQARIVQMETQLQSAQRLNEDDLYNETFKNVAIWLRENESILNIQEVGDYWIDENRKLFIKKVQYEKALFDILRIFYNKELTIDEGSNQIKKIAEKVLIGARQKIMNNRTEKVSSL